MRLQQLDGLVAFATVARTRSFTEASALLEVTPQAISQSVRALEERIAVRLFNRTTRSVGLTEAGERLLAKVGPALAEVFEALESVRDLSGRPSGLLRLNLPRPAYLSLVEPILAGFRKTYPEIRLELSFDDGFVDIVERGFDAGIRLGESVAKDMVSLPLTRQERIAILGSPEYFAQRPAPRTIAELKEHQCIRFRMPSTGVLYRWELLEGKRLIEVHVEGSLTVNDTSALVRAALDGLGLAYVLESTAQDPIALGKLARVLEPHCPVFPGFHLYYPSRRQVPAKLRCLIEFLKAARDDGARPGASARRAQRKLN
ncbi:MAG: LysR family transcriptional regulator [Burkholderiaceae bacterium]